MQRNHFVVDQNIMSGTFVFYFPRCLTLLLLFPGLTLAETRTDEKADFRVGGRIHLDQLLSHAPEWQPDKNATLRRSRLSLRTNWQDWRAGVDINLNQTERRYQSAWISRDWQDWRFTIGQMQEPFGLEAATGSNQQLFMENSLSQVFVPSVNLGLNMQYAGKQWGGHFGWFWDSYLEDEDPFSGERGQGISTRFSFAPIMDKGNVLHIGASVSHREPENQRLRYRVRPESNLVENWLLDSGRIRDVQHHTVYGLELAWQHQQWLLQAEYLNNQLNRVDGRRDQQFNGHYVSASYLFGNKPRRYSAGAGRFGEVRQPDWSTWELAVRHSQLDLDDSVIRGGQQQLTTLGLNWYPHQHWRLMLNYIYSREQSETQPLLQTRLQFYY